MEGKEESLVLSNSEIQPSKPEEGFSCRVEFSIVLSSTLWSCNPALRAILPFCEGGAFLKLSSLLGRFPIGEFGTLTTFFHFVLSLSLSVQTSSGAAAVRVSVI